MNDRKGFTLVELLVVAVLGALVLVATYNVLITNQRTYTVNAANIQGQQTVRAGMDVLFSELREISPSGGDLINMDDQSVTIRVMRAAAILCDTVPKGPLGLARNPYKVVNLGDKVAANDSMWLFDENDSTITDDDTWFRIQATVRVDATTCQGLAGQELRFAGATFLVADTPTLGSLARVFTTYTYELGAYNGEPYLVRRASDGTEAPLVGPIRADDGVSFEYLDSDGNVTADGDEVAQIVVTVRTESQARDAQGDLITDSLKTRVYTRN